MKRHEWNFRRLLDRTFARFQKMPPAPADPAWDRVLERLREEPDGASASAQAALDSVRPVPPMIPTIQTIMASRRLWVAAAAVVVAAIWIGVVWHNHGVYARLESADGSLYRIVEGKAVPIRAGERIEAQQTVHSNGGAGAFLSLPDGSRLELRSQAEFSIERATDGIRIHLSRGSLIVSAAKQHAGHLYVETKEVTVSVVGTVFLVNAEEEGSRVGVIEGEVHVKQGPTETKLGPGEQMATNPNMELLSLKDEVAWSSQAVTHMAMLEQAVPASGIQAAKGLRFEVASVRPSGAAAPSAPGARGGGDMGNYVTPGGCVPGSSGYTQQLDPRRLAVTRTTLFQLIVWAYPVQGEGLPDVGPFGLCDQIATNADLISGAPSWTKSDMWDLQAGIPEGVFSSKPKPSDPKLQQMLQTLLAERFKLVIRRETREVPVYLLKVGRNGPKFNGHSARYAQTQAQTFRSDTRGGTPVPVSEQPPPPNGSFQMSPRRLSPGIFGNNFEASNVSMESWARYLFGGPGQLDRPVLDRTGLAGRFDFHFESDVPVDISGNGSPEDLTHGLASAKREAVKAMGFELEEGKAPYEVWVIVSVEKPSDN